jgi:hypothetical protein
MQMGDKVSNIEPKRSGHPRVYEILDELAELHEKKNRDYASANDPLGNFRRVSITTCGLLNQNIPSWYHPAVVAMMYMSKQYDAMVEMVANNKVQGQAEGLIDKMKDIAVYAVITMVLLEEAIAADKGDY